MFRNRKNAKGREPKNTGREPGLKGTGSGRFKLPCPPPTVKGKAYIQKALVITNEIGDRSGEAADYINLGTTCHFLGEYATTREYYEKALKVSKEIGDIRVSLSLSLYI